MQAEPSIVSTTWLPLHGMAANEFRSEQQYALSKTRPWRGPGEGLELRAGDDRLASTYEHAPVGILEIDQDGRILRVNRKVCG